MNSFDYEFGYLQQLHYLEKIIYNYFYQKKFKMRIVYWQSKIPLTTSQEISVDIKWFLGIKCAFWRISGSHFFCFAFTFSSLALSEMSPVLFFLDLSTDCLGNPLPPAVVQWEDDPEFLWVNFFLRWYVCFPINRETLEHLSPCFGNCTRDFSLTPPQLEPCKQKKNYKSR